MLKLRNTFKKVLLIISSNEGNTKPVIDASRKILLMRQLRPRKTNIMCFLPSAAPRSKSSDMSTQPGVITEARNVKGTMRWNSRITGQRWVRGEDGNGDLNSGEELR